MAEPEMHFDVLAREDAKEAWVLEVSMGGYGYVPSRDHRPFPSEAAAEQALALFAGGGIAKGRARRYIAGAAVADWVARILREQPAVEEQLLTVFLIAMARAEGAEATDEDARKSIAELTEDERRPILAGIRAMLAELVRPTGGANV